MSTESVSRLLDAVFDDIGEVNVTELSVRTSLETAESPVLWRCLLELFAEDSIDLVHHHGCHVIDVFQVRDGLSDDILHPLVIGGAESCVPVVQNCKFCRYNAASAALQALTTGLDLLAQIEPPLGVSTWCVENCCDVVLQDHGCEEAHVDVAAELENIVVLPIQMVSRVGDHPVTMGWITYQIFCLSLRVFQERYLPSSFTENSDSAMWLWLRENMSKTATTPGGIIMILSEAIESG